MSKKFLIPVSSAVAALISNSSNAISSLQSIEKERNGITSEASAKNEAQINLKQYIKDGEIHEVLMKKTDNGILFAQHRSHYSHSSHSSHRSSR